MQAGLIDSVFAAVGVAARIGIAGREAAKAICLQRYQEFGCAGQGSRIKPTALSVMIERYRKGELAQAVV